MAPGRGVREGVVEQIAEETLEQIGLAHHIEIGGNRAFEV